MKFYDNQLSDSLIKDVASFMKESKKPSIKYDEEGAHVLDATGKVVRTFKQRDNGDDFKKKAQNYLTQKMRELNASFEPKEPLIVEKSLDPVDKKELKGKHKDRADKDIDNDGDVDSSDKYLHKKRKAISKAMKEDAEVEEGKMVPGFMGADGKPTSKPTKKDYEANKEYQAMKKKGVAPKVKEEGWEAGDKHDEKAVKSIKKDVKDAEQMKKEKKAGLRETDMMSGDKKKKSMPEIKKDMEKAVDKANDKLKEEAATMVDRVVAEISDQMKKRYISKAQKEITSKEKEKDMVRKNMDKNPGNFSDANKKSSDAKYDAETNKRRKGIRQAASKLGEAEDVNKDNAEKAMKHDCAKHVAHESYGEGTCIPGMHTIIEDENGEYFVSHYDVMFESEDGYNIVEDIPVEELKIYTEMVHSHGKKKKGY
tara:strand:- start:4455 stop:5729 length:1275 start_codon:yes stop_codon:yes gene_type:complete